MQANCKIRWDWSPLKAYKGPLNFCIGPKSLVSGIFVLGVTYSVTWCPYSVSHCTFLYMNINKNK